MNNPSSISWNRSNNYYILPILTCYLTENNCFKAGSQIISGGDYTNPTQKINGIVVHSTACEGQLSVWAGPLNNSDFSEDNKYGNNSYSELTKRIGSNPGWNVPNPGGRSTCVHAFLGKQLDGTFAVVNTLPYNFACWGCGLPSPYNSFNYLPIGRIQFEICEDANTHSREYFEQAIIYAAMYCAYLCFRLNLNPNIDKDYYATLYNSDGTTKYPMYNTDVNCQSNQSIKVPTICSHGEANTMGLGSGHIDPSHWWDKFNYTMDDFRQLVIDAYNDAEDNKFLYNNSNINDSGLIGSIYNTTNYLNVTQTSNNIANTSSEYYQYVGYIDYKDAWTSAVGLPENTLNPSEWVANNLTNMVTNEIPLTKLYANQRDDEDRFNFIYNKCKENNVPVEMALSIFLSESGCEWGAKQWNDTVYYGIGCFNKNYEEGAGGLYAKYGMRLSDSPEADVEICIKEMAQKINYFRPMTKNRLINIQEISGQYCNNFSIPDYLVWAYQAWQAGNGGAQKLVENDEYLYPGSYVKSLPLDKQRINCDTMLNARKIGLFWAGLVATRPSNELNEVFKPITKKNGEVLLIK